MPEARKARVFMSGRSQHITIPVEFRFSSREVYIRRDPASGDITISEKPPQRSLEEIFADLDAAGAADFVLERDMSLPPDRDLF